MQIRFTVRNLDVVKKLMRDIPRGVKVAAMEAFTDYIIGDKNHGLKHEPSQKEHGPGNPFEWTSEKQRKAFFATDGFGQGIPTVRTHEGVNSWTRETKDSNWTQVYITGGNKFVQGDDQQIGHKKDGWRTYTDIVTTNLKGAYRKALKAVNDWLNKKVK
jgi:hypothetical protein